MVFSFFTSRYQRIMCYIWHYRMSMRELCIPLRRTLLTLLLLCPAMLLRAQQTADDALRLVAEKNYDKALEVYGQLYERSPDSFYTDYLQTMLLAGKFKNAEKLAEKRASLMPPQYTRTRGEYGAGYGV